MIWKKSGEMIGWSGLQPLEETGETEVGYGMIKEFWGTASVLNMRRRDSNTDLKRLTWKESLRRQVPKIRLRGTLWKNAE